jgi:uncharacterized membrane protein
MNDIYKPTALGLPIWILMLFAFKKWYILIMIFLSVWSIWVWIKENKKKKFLEESIDWVSE